MESRTVSRKTVSNQIRITKKVGTNSRAVVASKPRPKIVKSTKMAQPKTKVSTHGLKYECMVQGPIFLTAAHSAMLLRGVGIEGARERIHLREEWVSYIVLRLAYYLSKIHSEKKQAKAKSKKTLSCNSIASFMVWSKDKKYDTEDLDPNYLTEELYPHSDFHIGLRKWLSSLQESDVPFHIDIHGKINRKTDRNIDVGIESMYEVWPHDDPDQEFAKVLDEHTGGMIDQTFRSTRCGAFQVKGISDGYLSGFWGHPIETMTTQSVNLGIPSFQLEIPRAVRKELSKNDKLMMNLAQGIYELYENVVGPLWKEKALSVNREKYFMDTVENTYKNANPSGLDSLSKEYYIWENYAKDRVI